MRLIRPTVAALLAALALAACSDNPSEPTTPTSITVGSGTTITGRVGDTTTVTVTVLNANKNPLANQSVTFAVTSGGGSVTPTTATTNASGQATTKWVLGTTIGSQLLTVTTGGVSQVITSTTAAGLPRSVSFTAGASQTTTVNGTVTTAPAVTVKDAGGNGVANVQVNFTSTPSGTVTPQTILTDANGVARVTSWQLGGTAGTYTLTANVAAAGVTGNPATITATATAGAAAGIATTAGNNISATAGSQLAGSLTPAVVVRDAAGNPVSGVQVTFSVVSGGGTITGATQTTNAQGVATVGGFTLGRTAGPNVIQATAAGAGTATFNITGTAGPAAAIAIETGNNQSVRAGQVLPTAPSVRVVDVYGNPISGATVTFTVGSGGGTITGGTATTNAQGIATVGSFTLGTTPGTNTLVVSTPGAPNATITATGLAGAAAVIKKLSGDSATVVAFRTAAQPFVVQVLDAANFPVQGATVTFALPSNNTGSLTSTTVVTDATGKASTSFVANGVLGINQVTATVGSLPPVTFTITTTQNTVANITALAPLTQSASVGAPVASSPAVKMVDAQGNPVPGVKVFFVASNGSSVQNPTAITDQNGIASAGTWTLSATPGTNTVAAISNVPGTVPNATVEFKATGVTVPAGATLTVLGTIPTTAPAGSSVPLSVQVNDANGAALAGISVTFEVTVGGGNIGGSTTFTTVTNASGVATAPNWVLGSGSGVTNSVVVNVVNGPSAPISVVTQ